MKVAYLVHFRGGRESGILRKVAAQAATWSSLGAEVGLFVATSPKARTDWSLLPGAVSVHTPPAGPLSLLREREALITNLRRWAPDVVYMRHGLVHPGLIGLVREIPTVVEINGDDLAEFRLRSRRRYLLARSTRGLLLSRAVGLVFVTRELAARDMFARYARPSIVIGNGIDLDAVTWTPAPENDRLRLLFLGHPHTPWHGVDHVRQLAEACPEWRFDIVGPGSDELANDPPANLMAHGPMEPAAYAPIVAQADVAIGTLALYRKGMDEASPLKVREYLAAGLPVIAGYLDTDFPDGAPFLLRVSNGDNGVADAVAEIRAFAVAWKGRRVPRADVAHLDVRVKETARLGFIMQVAHA